MPDLSKRSAPRLQMGRDQEAAHRRMASLPTFKHTRPQVDRSEIASRAAERSARTKRNRGELAVGVAVVLPGSRTSTRRKKT